MSAPGPHPDRAARAVRVAPRTALGAAIALGLIAAGCSSSTVTHEPPVPGPRAMNARVGGVREEAVERAVRRNADVAVSSASCRAPARGAWTPFGNTNLPVMHCLVGIHRGLAWYEVEVLRNGCFLGEADAGGGQIRGCGVNALDGRHVS